MGADLTSRPLKHFWCLGLWPNCQMFQVYELFAVHLNICERGRPQFFFFLAFYKSPPVFVVVCSQVREVMCGEVFCSPWILRWERLGAQQVETGRDVSLQGWAGWLLNSQDRLHVGFWPMIPTGNKNKQPQRQRLLSGIVVILLQFRENCCVAMSCYTKMIKHVCVGCSFVGYW